MTPETPPISLRPAVPTAEDGLAFARLLDEAQEGYFRAALGRRAADVIARAFTEPDHELSYQHVTLAEQSGQIVGMHSGYTAEAHRHFTDGALRAVAGWRGYRLAAFTRLTRRMVRFMNTLSGGDFYVRALAAEPAHAAGSARLALDVAAKNRRARRLYERLGMTAEAESPRWFGLPNTNLIRMTKSL